MRTWQAVAWVVLFVVVPLLGFAATGLGAEAAAPARAEQGEILPETFQFLGLGWFIVHLVAIPVVFAIGYVMGKKSAAR